MDLAAELVRFNPDPALANWIAGTVQTLLDQAQKDAAHASAELRTAHTKIQALTLELAHLRRMRFGVRSEALTVEQRDLFQETWASDIAAAEAELAKQQTDACVIAEPTHRVLVPVVSLCPIIYHALNIATNQNPAPVASAGMV